ncbi:hypothetical protein ACR9PT_10935 [Piscirickettsia salmonis]|uniref:hypothetical protein n=1 Tax=Piscirickettsia salmonis TaxID=1238 RepID=UPI003EB91DCF
MEKITTLIGDLQKRITKLDGQIEEKAKSSFIIAGLLEKIKNKGLGPVKYYSNVLDLSRNLSPKMASWSRKALLLCTCKNMLEEIKQDDSKALGHSDYLKEVYLEPYNLAVFKATLHSETKSLCSRTHRILKSIAKENQKSAAAVTSWGGGAYAVTDIVSQQQSAKEGLQVVELPQTQPAMQG